jgi:bacterioferritin-associated ferredoxin
MVICQCRRLSDRKVVKALRAGSTSVRELCQSTGAGQVCGGCVGSLKSLIEKHFAESTTPGWEPHEAA